jgi:hypothetical protein
MSSTTVVPEKTLPPVPANAAAAAVAFSQAYQEFQQAIRRGFNKLDEQSQRNLDELQAYMRMNPPRPATIINLFPWPLSIPGARLLQGITVPACPPGQRCAWAHIRGWRRDWEYEESGALKFKAVTPIKLAGEFVFAFSANEYSIGNAGTNGGVIIYEGETHPDKAGEVETYDATGRLITNDQPGLDYEGEQEVPVVHKIPVRRKLDELIDAGIQTRNRAFFARVQRFDTDYRDEKKRAYLSLELPRLMAEVLHAEGLLPEVPVWNLETRMQRGLRDDNCPACGAARKIDAIVCVECKYPLEPVECYANGIITFEQLEMHNLDADQWEQALGIRQQKESARKEALERVAAKTQSATTEDPEGHKGKGKKS